MQQEHFTLILTHLHCVKDTTETGKDEIYLEIFTGKGNEETYLGRVFYDNPHKMSDGDKNDDVNMSVSFDCTYVDYLRVHIKEKDAKGNKDDIIGSVYIRRDDPIVGTKRVNQTTGDARAIYDLSYRVVKKPIPTLRVMGVECIEDSKGCDVKTMEAVLFICSEAAGKASEIISKNPRPRAKLIGKAFGVASEIFGNAGDVFVWAANAIEGKDDVYMQWVDEDSHDVQGGAFWPVSGGSYKMEKGDSVFFNNEEGEESKEYFRIPMDNGPVTVQLRERDKDRPDVCIGAFTFDAAYYNANKGGAKIVIADDYFKGQQGGQGAIYSICISVGLEDWANAPSVDAQKA